MSAPKSVKIAEAMQPVSKRVVAKEADHGSYAKLAERLGQRAVCIQALIGPNGAERTWLSNTLASTGSTSVAPGDEPAGHDYLRRSTMRAVSLDTIERTHGMPNLVKIDVEGFEMAILDSAEIVLASRPAAVMEFNALCLSNVGRVNPRDALDRIRALFPRVEAITHDGLRPVSDRYAFLTEHMLQRARSTISSAPGAERQALQRA